MVVSYVWLRPSEKKGNPNLEYERGILLLNCREHGEPNTRSNFAI